MKISPKTKKIINGITYSILGLMVVAIVYILFLNLSGKPVFIFGKAVMWVKTNSMEDTIPAQSYIFVNKATGDDVAIGDVIVFYSDDPVLNGELNTHRVVGYAKNGRDFITKGDNNPEKDTVPARADAVIGIYSRNLPVMSFFGRFLSTAFGITVMAMILFLITLITFLPDIVSSIRQKQDETHKQDMEELIKKEVERLKAEEAAQDDNKSDSE